MKATPKEETVGVVEVWTPDGRHYIRFPNGMEWEVPKGRALKPDDYIFREGRWQPPGSTSAHPKDDE